VMYINGGVLQKFISSVCLSKLPLHIQSVDVRVVGVNLSYLVRFLIVYESSVSTIRLSFVVALFTQPVFLVVLFTFLAFLHLNINDFKPHLRCIILIKIKDIFQLFSELLWEGSLFRNVPGIVNAQCLRLCHTYFLSYLLNLRSWDITQLSH